LKREKEQEKEEKEREKKEKKEKERAEKLGKQLEKEKKKKQKEQEKKKEKVITYTRPTMQWECGKLLIPFSQSSTAPSSPVKGTPEQTEPKQTTKVGKIPSWGWKKGKEIAKSLIHVASPHASPAPASSPQTPSSNPKNK
jgi:hypothetical protein